MKISKKKRDKISEQILLFLYSVAPKPIFTAHIADEIARDEEFIKKLLLELENKKLIVKITKNSKGIKYLKRARWRLRDQVFQTYKHHQINTKQY